MAATAAILDVVRHGQAHSRREIIESTGLSRSIVTQRVADLLERGLVRETLAPSTGGRPPRTLEFCADAGHLLVADIGATSIDVALADLSGRILRHEGEPADVASGPEVILARVESMFRALLDGWEATGPIWGLGIGVPGPVEFRTGHPISPPIMPGWDGFPVRQYFTERFGAPVWVDNDVNIMALGEWRSGVARGHENVIFVKIGTGIGSGIISDGVIHRGAQGSAGDIGHVQIVEERSMVCRCGKVGCLEALAGGGALARDGAVLAANGNQRLARVLAENGAVTAADVGHAASIGDSDSVELLQASGRYVGQALAGLVNFFNPSLIVLGGGVASSGAVYLAIIRQTIYERSAPLATRDLVVHLSRLRDKAGVTGAASMVLDQLFSATRLEQWVDQGHPDAVMLGAA